MMARNPNWWSLNGMHPKFDHRLSSQSVCPFTSPLSSIPCPPDDCRHYGQDFPVRSRSELLLGGGSLLREQKNLGNWDDEVLNLNPSLTRVPVVDAKQEVARSSFQHYGHVGNEFQDHRCRPPQQVLPVSNSPIITSCTDNSCNNILNFSDGKSTTTERKNQKHSHDLTSECNRTSAGGVSKRARVQQSSAQPALKVRKEKLGDRITALHQLVSPFGKTDTASVLSEAIGYIRFLQGQIEALVSPHMRKPAASTGHHHQHSLNKFVNDSGMERGALKQDSQLGLSAEVVKDLRSRGLCLVPISCTQHVANDSGAADCWAPEAVGGGF